MDRLYRGPEIATAHVAGLAACLAEAMPEASPEQLVAALEQRAHWPSPGLGYA